MTSYTKMTNVCIKGVNRADWLYLKSEAVKEGRTMGEFLGSLISAYRSKPKTNWDEIMSRKPILTEEEANEMLNEINRAFRTETEFR